MNTLIALCTAIGLAHVPSRCHAQGSADAGSEPNAGRTGAQQNIRAATRTLDAISLLIDSIHARRAEQARVADPTRRIFDDVPITNHAYADLMTLYQHGILLGYPADFFSGQRTLTRYAVGVAIHRMFQSSNVFESVSSAGPARQDIVLVSKLVQEFDVEIRALGLNVREVRKRLNARLEKDSPRVK